MVKLALAQVHQLSIDVAGLAFDFPKVIEARDTVVQLCNTLQTIDISSKSEAELTNLVSFIEGLLIPWLHAFEVNHRTNLPREINDVVYNMCKDWVGAAVMDKYALLVSEGSYAFSRVANGSIYALINAEYHVKFNREILIVYFPKLFHNDFFTNTALFHEVGHFVSFKLNISDKVYSKVRTQLTTDASAANNLVNFAFPFLRGITMLTPEVEKRIVSHIDEYVADLFGAQYIGEHITNYLRYLAGDTINPYDYNHPETPLRYLMVSTFVNGGATNVLLDDIIEVFDSFGPNKELKLRKIVLDEHQLLSGNAINIATNEEAYSLFHTVWEIYIKGPASMEIERGLPTGALSYSQFYHQLNDVVKQSLYSYYV